MPTIRHEVWGLRVAGRMRGDADRFETEPASELDELRGVRELLVGLLLGKRITAQREEVLEPGSSKAADDLAQLEARMGHTGQVRHRREVGRPQKVDDDARRSLARDTTAAIRDRDEGWSERLQVGDRPSEQPLFDFVLWRKEFEREG